MHDITPRPGLPERLARLIRLRTVSAELETVDEPLALLRELYPLTHERLELERITDRGLLYRWPGRDSGADPLVLMAHLDVVPVEDPAAWTHPPFGGEIVGGAVWGRGALDDKGPLVVVLEAVENLLAAGVVPARDVLLAFGGDEEVRGSAACAVAATLRERGVVPWLVLDEGSAVVEAPLPGVVGPVAMIGVGEKGLLTLRLTARSAGGHASAPPRLTAVGRLARGHPAHPVDLPRLGPEALARALTLLAERAPGRRGTLYRLLGSRPQVAAPLLAALGGETAALVRTTIAPTMLRAGTADNVLAAEASVVLNLRLAPGETVSSATERVRRRVRDRELTVEVVAGEDPSPQSPSDGAPFAAVRAALAVSHPDAAVVPYVINAATDSRHLHRFAPAVYRFAPLLMSKEQRAGIHGVDERVDVAALERGEVFHRALITGLGA
ncbi:M20/M25/M40 family metallo-hydrolase [Rathayibacter sp. VKM Ac-2760]|uniref:M20/M25/M40 family metallo-hydrolase n=1 Tax=Rathayibacter sp. VKM Ac-2760 TaxID=2609253 RepID=UPI0013181730|nr:M20/M25/M40 family metallo-hydrolase [Rathayibacter sp. VKM Ac-2760]QHC58221.1 M20/M25/M40 family metallo-hydrolase [Rathayibacter sp. VKM Ac-2760]